MEGGVLAVDSDVRGKDKGSATSLALEGPGPWRTPRRPWEYVGGL